MSEDELKEKKYQEFCRFVEKCDETKEKNNQSQDKIVIAISSSLFGLLLAMHDKILSVQIGCFSEWLKIIIISNGLTLLLAIISYSIANLAIDKKIQIFLSGKKKKNSLDAWTRYINLGYLVTSIITIFALAVVLFNLF